MKFKLLTGDEQLKSQYLTSREVKAIREKRRQQREKEAARRARIDRLREAAEFADKEAEWQNK